MKYWEEIIEGNLTYEEARTAMAIRYVTRPEWDGFHFLNLQDKHCILLKTGELLIDIKEVLDTDKKDWCIVRITNEARKIIYPNE